MSRYVHEQHAHRLHLEIILSPLTLGTNFVKDFQGLFASVSEDPRKTSAEIAVGCSIVFTRVQNFSQALMNLVGSFQVRQNI